MRVRRILNKLLTATEVGMLAYWVLAVSMALGLVNVPPDWMYANHDDPMVVAWNWSFFPIDVLFAGTGLVARYSGRAPERLAEASLTLMFCAGTMALSFWTLRGEFDPFWWGANLWLVGMASVGLVLRWRSPDGAGARETLRRGP